MYSGREFQLTQAILNAVLIVLCVETDFLVVNSVEGEEVGDYCGSLRKLTENGNMESIILSEEMLQVEDEKDGQLEWTKWTIVYRVLQVGDTYRQLALEALGQEVATDEIQDTAVTLMEDTAQLALSATIQNKTFDALIGQNVRTSLVGQETEVFGDDKDQGGGNNKFGPT